MNHAPFKNPKSIEVKKYFMLKKGHLNKVKVFDNKLILFSFHEINGVVGNWSGCFYFEKVNFESRIPFPKK